MSNTGRGYSQAVIEAVEAADPKLVVTQFAKHCIKHRVPAAAVARHFGVSRPTVYNWFSGAFQPKAGHIEKMQSLLNTGKPDA